MWNYSFRIIREINVKLCGEERGGCSGWGRGDKGGFMWGKKTRIERVVEFSHGAPGFCAETRPTFSAFNHTHMHTHIYYKTHLLYLLNASLWTLPLIIYAPLSLVGPLQSWSFLVRFMQHTLSHVWLCVIWGKFRATWVDSAY